MTNQYKCRACGEPVVRSAQTCPNCQTAAPAYTQKEITSRAVGGGILAGLIGGGAIFFGLLVAYLLNAV